MIQIAVCNAEITALETLSKLVTEYAASVHGRKIAVQRFLSASDLLDFLAGGNTRFHVYLLNISKSGINDDDLGIHVRNADSEAVIVYLTDTTEYHLESFRAHPIQCLLKPITKDNLYPLLDEACKRILKPADANVIVRFKGGIACIRYHEIAYIEYMNHAITYHLVSGKALGTIAIRESFSVYVERYLQDKRFIKPHASYIVNMDYVHIMTAKGFETLAGESIPISKREYTQARKQFLEYMLAKNTGAIAANVF